jgi:hypothetical protein
MNDLNWIKSTTISHQSRELPNVKFHIPQFVNKIESYLKN